MGAYLSSPNCDKDTHEGANNRLAFAASSMQGWRMSQEDAHNAILNFDDNTSLFAVYDGHGGSEIAVYCSRYLPDFLKKLNSYQEGRLNDALIESFLKFDSILLDTDVKKILQKLANDDNEEPDQTHEFVNEENHHNDELNNIEEAQLLKKEAEVPIEELLKRYNENEKHFHSPNITKRILNNDEKIDQEATDQKTEVSFFVLKYFL
jgi:protein phosphatase 1G